MRMRMLAYPERIGVLSLVSVFIYIHTLYMRSAKVGKLDHSILDINYDFLKKTNKYTLIGLLFSEQTFLGIFYWHMLFMSE